MVCEILVTVVIPKNASHGELGRYVMEMHTRRALWQSKKEFISTESSGHRAIFILTK